jgi:hypothetical protein
VTYCVRSALGAGLGHLLGVRPCRLSPAVKRDRARLDQAERRSRGGPGVDERSELRGRPLRRRDLELLRHVRERGAPIPDGEPCAIGGRREGLGHARSRIEPKALGTRSMNPAKSSTIHVVRHTGAQLSNIARGDQWQLLKVFVGLYNTRSPR